LPVILLAAVLLAHVIGLVWITILGAAPLFLPADQTYKLRDKDKLQLGPETLIQVHIQVRHGRCLW